MEERFIDIPDFRNRYLLRGALTGKNDWWRYLLGTFYCVFGYLFFQVLAIYPLMNYASRQGISEAELQANPAMLFDADAIGMNKSLMLALLMGMFVFAFLGLNFAFRASHQKTLISVTTSNDHFRWGRYGFAFAVWAVISLLYFLVSYCINPESLILQWRPDKFPLLALVLIVFVPIQTATEELLFRGYLVQGLAIRFKSGLGAVVATSLLFGLMHMKNPEADAHGWMIMLPFYTCFGLFLGLITLLDEGLEIAMGIHMANNLISGLIVTSPNSVFQTDALFYTTVEDPGSDFLTWIVMAALCFGILFLKYRWKNFKLILK